MIFSQQTQDLRKGLNELGISWEDKSTDDGYFHHEITHFKDKHGYTNSAIFALYANGYQFSYGGPTDLEFWPHMDASTGDPYGVSVDDILTYAKENCL